MSKFLLIKVLPKLGFLNVFRVLIYKVGIQLRLNPVLKLQASPIPKNSYFYCVDKEVTRYSILPARQG